MLLQTNSYVVPKDKRTEHARLLNRFRQTLARLGCEYFEVYEQTGANWSSGESTGRFVQIMRFRDRNQQREVQAAEKTDPQAQALIQEFCELIDFPRQQQQGLFAVGFYNSVLAGATLRDANAAEQQKEQQEPPPLPAPEASTAPETAAEPDAVSELAIENEPAAADDDRSDTLARGVERDDLDMVKSDDNGQPLPEPQEHNSL